MTRRRSKRIAFAKRDLPPGERLGVRVVGEQEREFLTHLRGWCRAQGHEFFEPEPARDETSGGAAVSAWIGRGMAGASGRWKDAERAGPGSWAEPLDSPSLRWGFAARGALIEAGGNDFHYALREKELVWAENAPKLYEQAAAAPWNPNTAIPWDDPFDLEEDVEIAVVQVMTYLIENENAALQVPARFIVQIHPHFREIPQILAVQIADEARHVEVFTRRATLRKQEPGLSAVSGQQSLRRFAVGCYYLASNENLEANFGGHPNASGERGIGVRAALRHRLCCPKWSGCGAVRGAAARQPLRPLPSAVAGDSIAGTVRVLSMARAAKRAFI
jgi:hypothetical protein